jgi:3-oxoacyl-[acyl-carrier-protein] synthase II
MLVAPRTQGQRVAVTGIGVAGPGGVGREAFWAGLHTAPRQGFDRRVEGFDASHLYDEKQLRRIDRFNQLAMHAAVEALEQAGELRADPDRIGTMVGTGVGGLQTLEDEIIKGHDRGLKRVSPFLVPSMMNNAGAAGISMRFGFRGPCETVVTACAAGTHSVTNGARLVASGRCDVVVAGSSEAPLSPTGVAAFTNMTAITKSGWSRPFDARRDGFVIAEGAGILVLEAWDHAVGRGATILAEVLGGASTADAHHITAPAPGGSGALTCMQQALDDAGLSPEDIGHVNAHGTSTTLNDAAEAEALGKLFGLPGPPVTSTKGVTGHALGGAGSMEAVIGVLTLLQRSIPPTVGTDAVDPELAQIDLVIGDARSWEPAPLLSNSFGFGGHNGTLVLGPA